MVTRVQKWGNSLAVRIPRAVAEDTHLSPGKAVEVVARDGRVVIAPAHPRRPTLGELLKGVSARNRHAAIDTGPAVGAEAW